MPSQEPFRNPTSQPDIPREPASEPPFVIRVEHLDVKPGGHFRPEARVSFAAPLRALGLLAALPPEGLRDLLLLLTFVTPNGHCAPTLQQIAHAMRVSQGKARGRMERLEVVRWQASPLLWHGQAESGLEFFSPLPALCPVREDATVPSAYVPPPPILAAPREAVIAHSRAAYARPRAEVEREIEAQLGYGPGGKALPRRATGTPPSPLPHQPQASAPQKAVPLSAQEAQALREREEVGGLLQHAGLDAEQAEGLLERYDPLRIRRQLMWLPYRKAKNPAGMLLAAVKDDYEAPLMGRKALPSEPLEIQAQPPEVPPVGTPGLHDLDPGHEVALRMPDDPE